MVRHLLSFFGWGAFSSPKEGVKFNPLFWGCQTIRKIAMGFFFLPNGNLSSRATFSKTDQVELRYLVLMYQKKVIKRFNAETTLADLLACKKKDLAACLAHGKKVRSKF